MIKKIMAAAAGIILAISLSLYSHEGGLEYLKFHLGLLDRAEAEKEIEDALKRFNKYFAGFFNTGGGTAGLNEFPAENMIKRRIFQEINTWTKKEQVLVYDRDVFELEGIDFPGPERAIAVAREVWFLSVQERQTRKHFSAVKANPVRVRYIMNKIRGEWQVQEYEVFAEDDRVPPMPRERL